MSGIREEYMTLGLDKKLDFEVFKQAVDGFKKVKKEEKCPYNNRFQQFFIRKEILRNRF